LPLLTHAGKSFASRVAASLLLAVNMPELIAGSLTAYEDMAVALTCDPARVREMREMLAAKRLESPIFNTVRYARDLEAAYQAVYDRHHAGDQPAHVNEHLLI
jgi:predicted O-linked N-acetylglucosamine transferase (SPINDLY family)